MDNQTKVHLILTKIEPAFDNSGESKLMFAVIERALRDLVMKGVTLEEKLQAITYLKNKMPHAELCGISSQWIRRVIYRVGLDFEEIRSNAIKQEAQTLVA